MLFKLVNYTVMGIAVFYAAEGFGIIERGRYFPTLPRLEASASDPYAWLGAAQWGVSQVASFARDNQINEADLPAISARNLDLDTVTTYAKRLEEKRDEALKSTSFGYYGS